MAIAPLLFGSAINSHFAVEPWTTEKVCPRTLSFLCCKRAMVSLLGTGYGLARFDGIHFKLLMKLMPG